MGRSTLAVAALVATSAVAQTELDTRLQKAAATLAEFTGDGSLPVDSLAKAYGVAIIPGLLRGGFMLGGRRGKGVLVVRMPDGTWSNPSFIKVTGGSIGWQIGVEAADTVLVFANQESIRRIGSGKFALGGDASAVAGPAGRHNTAAVTFKSEIYAHVKSHGLFAGASVEGAKLGIDHEANSAYYGSGAARALAAQVAQTPANARRLLLTLEPHDSPRQGSPIEAANAPARTFAIE